MDGASSAINQGFARGMSTPTKATGLSEMIKTITNDLRASKMARMKSKSDLITNRVNILKTAMSANYQGDFNKFLQTGDLSSLRVPKVPTSAEKWAKEKTFGMEQSGFEKVKMQGPNIRNLVQSTGREYRKITGAGEFMRPMKSAMKSAIGTKEFNDNVGIGMEQINKGEDPFKIFQMLSQKYPKDSVWLKRQLIEKSSISTSIDDLIEALP